MEEENKNEWGRSACWQGNCRWGGYIGTKIQSHIVCMHQREVGTKTNYVPHFFRPQLPPNDHPTILLFIESRSLCLFLSTTNRAIKYTDIAMPTRKNQAPPPQPATGDDNHHKDKTSFAAALAHALHEADAATPSTEELCEETYLQLCLDDPLVSAAGCHALAQALSSLLEHDNNHNKKKQQKPPVVYAPSNRLVQGIEQVCQRVSSSQNPTSKSNPHETHSSNKETDANLKNNNIPENESSIPEPAASLFKSEDNNPNDTASAAAELAWMVFARIPLACCLSRRLEDAARLLGSYRGPAAATHNDQEDPNDDDTKNEDTTLQQEPQEQQELNSTNNHDNNTTNDHDSLAEVWAAESDPSDYGFDSGWNPQAQLAELDAWAAIQVQVNPHELSQVPPNPQWTDLASAVAHLVQHHLHSSKFSALSLTQIRRLQVVEYLTQWTVTLALVPSSSPLFHHASTPNDKEDGGGDDSWQRLALQPLYVLRDLVTLHPAALLDEYLTLLQQLIQVDHQLSSTTTNSATTRRPQSTLVEPATWMGLTALSAVCHQYRTTTTPTTTPHLYAVSIRTRVLQLADDLCAILEKAQPLMAPDDTDDNNTDDDNDTTRVQHALPWTILPLFQILVVVPDTSGRHTLTTAQAQLLLNSGLFRQWIGWWDRQLPSNQSSSILLKTAMEYTVWNLCTSAPTLLGKYAWRYPNLAARVTNPPPNRDQEDPTNATTATTHTPQALVLLWNLLGIHLSLQDGSSSTTTVQWRTSNSSPPQATRPSPSDCRKRAWQEFVSLCQTVETVVTRWKTARSKESLTTTLPDTDSNNNSTNNSTTNNNSLLQIVEEDWFVLEQFHDLAHHLTTTTTHTLLLVPMFCREMPLEGDVTVPDDKKHAALRHCLSGLQQALSTWEPLSPHVVAKLKDDDDTDDGTKQESFHTTNQIKVQRQQSAQDTAMAQLRKSIKLIHSAMDSCTTTTSTNMVFSSKAD